MSHGGVLSHTPRARNVRSPHRDQHNAQFPAGEFQAAIDPIFREKRIMEHVTPDEAHYSQAAQPAPGTLALLALAGLILRRRRRG